MNIFLFCLLRRRICSAPSQTAVESSTQSFVQPVHKPIMTLCEGKRVCSTYRTTYRVSYRQVTKRTSHPLYTCCPGWKKTETYSHTCNRALCQLPCQNGGTCVSLNICECTAGWSGIYCQKDVDECKSGAHRCSQLCVNSAGSFHCECVDGYQLAGDGKTCDYVAKPTAIVSTSAHELGVPDSVKEEMKALRSKIEVLEQKLHLLLSPLHSLSTSSPNDPITLLTHSFQQLDRIDSLSEQISFLEEKLETCKCDRSIVAPTHRAVWIWDLLSCMYISCN
ncbi:hypothetical protein GDO86_014865 [Hymenochirus boettgeri]|uniref:Epidermal growth factor-like protein 7 n=1 Tax=Hymenochirus boettgeri TaxID=247094 RepID=A0A8T2JV90_9PIPI|nr:hypothetical protein GDO86_014865 [Hymenochirus boettgeri]